VYRTSNSKGFRVFTYISPLVCFAVAFGVLVGASSLHLRCASLALTYVHVVIVVIALRVLGSSGAHARDLGG
jgi:sorbitol-specific phosphotransferase system component IIC